MKTTMKATMLAVVIALMATSAVAQGPCLNPEWHTVADLNPQLEFETTGTIPSCPGTLRLTNAPTHHETNASHYVCARGACYVNTTDTGDDNSRPDGTQYCLPEDWTRPSGISGGAESAIFAHGYQWSKARVFAQGYMKGSMDGFRPEPDRYSRSIDDSFLDGMAITYGYPRNYMHSYMVGLSKGLTNFSYFLNGNCPCHDGTETGPQWMVGLPYYCDSGITGHFHHNEGAAGVGWYDSSSTKEFSDEFDDGLASLMFEEYETCIGEKKGTYEDWASRGLKPGELLWENPTGAFLTEPIEIRIMSGQSYANEDLGLTELKIEVYGCKAEEMPVCGDGVVDPYFEECDDGNMVDGDGTCSRMCTYYDPLLKPKVVEAEDDLNKITTTNFRIQNPLLPPRWVTVADVDATRDQACPGNMELHEHNVFKGTYMCGMKLRSPDVSTSHYAKFATRGLEYTKVKGKVEGYVKGRGNVFESFNEDGSLKYPDRSGNRTVNDQYIDGISITTESPRQHIFSYAIGSSRANDGTADGLYAGNCPSIDGYDPSVNYPPEWLGTYYCDAGAEGIHGNSWEPKHMFVDAEHTIVAEGTSGEAKTLTWWEERGLLPGEFEVTLDQPSTRNLEVRTLMTSCQSSFYCNPAADKIYLEIYVGPTAPPPPSQVAALLSLKEALGSPEALLSWNLEYDPDVCADWEGVFCRKDTSSVVGLELNGFLLTNVIDTDVDAGAVADALADLPDLEFIDLANNAISGDLSAFSTASSLKYLDVSGNDFSGPITPVCSLPQIEIIIVSANENVTGDLSQCTAEATLSLVSAFGTGLSDCGLAEDSDAIVETSNACDQ